MLLGIAVAAMVLVGLAAAFVYTGGRWGCPSQAELERAREPEEVLAAFADDGIRLVPATLLPGALLGDRRYRGAQVYHYVTKRAALFVLVCKVRCGLYVPPQTTRRYTWNTSAYSRFTLMPWVRASVHRYSGSA